MPFLLFPASEGILASGSWARLVQQVNIGGEEPLVRVLMIRFLQILELGFRYYRVLIMMYPMITLPGHAYSFLPHIPPSSLF